MTRGNVLSKEKLLFLTLEYEINERWGKTLILSLYSATKLHIGKTLQENEANKKAHLKTKTADGKFRFEICVPTIVCD